MTSGLLSAGRSTGFGRTQDRIGSGKVTAEHAILVVFPGIVRGIRRKKSSKAMSL